jgi:N-methylhydantoinase A
MAAHWQVGIDIGGTFTDVVARRAGSGEVAFAKVASRPDDPISALLSALEAVGLDWRDVDDLVHGTTMVTNAIIEDRLDRVALITTKGFADTLAIGRQNRRYLYALDLAPKLPPQVAEDLRFEVSERLDAKGGVLVELTEDEIEKVVKKVKQSGVDAVAVSLLHAHANPAHEIMLGQRLSDTVPYVAMSHRINPESREFERTSTTALSASLMPLASNYLDRIEQVKPDDRRLHMFHSAGGMSTTEVIREMPLGLALSGPAAGVSATTALAGELDLASVISFDMGGTTTDVCLVVDGRPEITSTRSLAERPLRTPMVAVESIGAGGGSIARLDEGVLRVGPESAGADPGPACYGRGGVDPTVTDAHLILGYLDPDRPGDSGIELVRDAAERSLEPLATETKTSLAGLGLGILKVVNASMVRALRKISVERGIDGRDATLVAFGGAGPMHAVELARDFGMKRVLVPYASSLFSAVGCLTAEMSYTEQREVSISSEAWDKKRLDRILGDMKERLRQRIPATDNRLISEETALIRYRGQSYTVEIESPALRDPAALAKQFRDAHETLYGFATDEPWQLVAVRIRFSVPRSDSFAVADGKNTTKPHPHKQTDCWFTPCSPVATPRYDRAELVPGHVLSGPSIIEDQWSTTVLPPGADLSVDDARHLHIDVGGRP